MKRTYTAPVRDEIGLSQEIIEVPAPLENEDPVTMPLWQKLLPLGMLGVMGIMFYVMASTGGRNMLFAAPMMLMMPLMMLIPMLSRAGGSGPSPAELNRSRRQWLRELTEIRKKAQASGERLFDILEGCFPCPEKMLASIGASTGSGMWSFDAATPGGLAAGASQLAEVSFEPFMSARLGRSVVELMPALAEPELTIPELIEPVTGVHLRKFMRTQPYVAGVPVGVSFNRSTALARTAGVGLDGDRSETLDVARAMVLSLAFNHSPDVLRLAVVTSDAPQWEWIKWLPHISHPAITDRLGPERMVFESMEDLRRSVDVALLDGDETPNLIVVVDTPGAEVRNPFASSKAVSFLVCAAGIDHIAVDPACRFTVADSKITLPLSGFDIAADAVSRPFAELFARKMAAYGTLALVGAAGLAAEDDTAADTAEIQPWHEVIGMPDPEAYDAQAIWQRSVHTHNLAVPIGYAVDDETNEIIPGEIVNLDVADPGVGGTGPHGIGAGTTGTGKSFWIKAFTLGLATKYSPSKVSFILMDFKGGATFLGYNRLPHTIAVISNLAGEADMLARAHAVIEGLMAQRQELWSRCGVVDIIEFRKRRAAGEFADIGDQPEVLIIVDEFAEFIRDNPDFKELLSSVGRIGRTLGVRIFPASQAIDPMMIGDLSANLGWGMSLRAQNNIDSSNVIKSPLATTLPSGKGDGYLLRTAGANPGLFRFRGFNVAAPVVVKRVAESVTVIDHDDTGDSDIQPFTAARIEGSAELDAAPADFDELVFEWEDTPDDDTPEQAGDDAADESGTQATAVIDSLARFNRADLPHAPRLWTPPMKIPFTLAESGVVAPTSSALTISVGDVDDPFRHRRVPMILDLSGRDSSTMIYGAPKAGKTVALQSVACALALTYPASEVQTILIDWSGTSKLLEVEDYPNVIGAATGRQIDAVLRFTGTLRSLMELRSDRMTKWKCSDVTDYLARRGDDTSDDPYGRIVVIIDGYDRFFSDAQDAAGEHAGVMPEWGANLIAAVESGSACGIHVVATSFGKLPYTATKKVTFTPIALSGAVNTINDDALTALSAEARRAYTDAIKTIPEGQPGRGVDIRSGLHMRFRVPSTVTIEPIGVDEAGNPVYDNLADHSSEIKELAAAQGKAADPAVLPPRLVAVPEKVPFPQVLTAVLSTAPPTEADKDIYLPFGVGVSDIAPVYATTGDTVLAFGGAGSGRRTFLRDMVYAIHAQGSPETTQVVLLDRGQEMWPEMDLLRSAGMLAGYAPTVAEAEKLVGQLAAGLSKRAQRATNLSQTWEETRQRSWYGGPDFFLVINSLDTFAVRGYSASPVIAPLVNFFSTGGRGDLGLTIIGAGRDSAADAVVGSPLVSTVSARDPLLLRLSGSPAHRLSPYGKFVPNLPPGRADLLLPGQITPVQLAFSEPPSVD